MEGQRQARGTRVLAPWSLPVEALLVGKGGKAGHSRRQGAGGRNPRVEETSKVTGQEGWGGGGGTCSGRVLLPGVALRSYYRWSAVEGHGQGWKPGDLKFGPVIWSCAIVPSSCRLLPVR